MSRSGQLLDDTSNDEELLPYPKRTVWQRHRSKIIGLGVGSIAFILMVALLVAICGVSFAWFPITLFIIGGLFAATITGFAAYRFAEENKTTEYNHEYQPTHVRAAKAGLKSDQSFELIKKREAEKKRLNPITYAPPSEVLERFSHKKFTKELGQICEAICSCLELLDTITRVTLRGKNCPYPAVLLMELFSQGTLSHYDDAKLKTFLERFNLHGLVNIYMTANEYSSKEIETIYLETETQFKDLFDNVKIKDIEAIKQALKLNINSNDWRVILRQLINEGKVKVGAEAGQSVRALFTECGLEKSLPVITTPEPEPVTTKLDR